MSIKQYLKKYNINVFEFAVKCKIRCPSLLYSYMNGKHVPSLTTAENIEKGTNGEVTIKDLRG